MIIDQYGRPFANKEGTNFGGASTHRQEVANWMPHLADIDEEVKEKGALEARIRDLTRNNGYVSGALRTVRNNVVGASYKLSLNPDNRLLGLSQDQIADWQRQVEGEWATYADSPECWIDARRERTFTEMMRMAAGMDFLHGEFFVSKEWQNKSVNKYSTRFSLIDPTRVQSVKDGFDFGIKRDAMGAPTQYQVKVKSKNGSFESDTYKTTSRYRFQWLQFAHVFDADRPDQARGFSRVSAAVGDIKQLDRYERAELERAIVDAYVSLYVKSDDPFIKDAFANERAVDAQGRPTKAVKDYMDYKSASYDGQNLTFDGKQIPFLKNGEEIKTVNASMPGKSFAEFEQAMLRPISRSLGMGYESLTGDYGSGSYVSIRMSLSEAYKDIEVTRSAITDKAASLMLNMWLNEAVDKGFLRPPVNFWDNRDALSRCTWIASGRPIVDELKTARSNKLNLEMGTKTLQAIATEGGRDWESDLAQRGREADARIKQIEERGVKLTDDQKIRLFTSDLVGETAADIVKLPADE